MKKANCDDWATLTMMYFFNIFFPIYFAFFPGLFLYNEISAPLAFIGYIFWLFSIYTLINCTFTDPGIIKRGTENTPPKSLKNIENEHILEDISNQNQIEDKLMEETNEQGYGNIRANCNQNKIEENQNDEK